LACKGLPLKTLSDCWNYTFYSPNTLPDTQPIKNTEGTSNILQKVISSPFGEHHVNKEKLIQ